MSQFLRKALLFRATSHSQVSLQNPNFTSLRFRWFSDSLLDDDKSKSTSFVVSYLENSLGFSPETALRSSKFLNFHSPDKPDKAIDLFKSFGFSQNQISKLVLALPQVLTMDIEKIILPKLEFLKSKGVIKPEMAKMLSCYPKFLRTSLDDQIIPSYDYLKNLLKCDKRTINAVTLCPNILCFNLNDIVARINFLRERGMSNAHIASLLEKKPRHFTYGSDRFSEAVEEVANMGFKASTANFMIAVKIFLSLSKSTWESKVKLYCEYGFSEKEVLKLFRVYPNTMSYSETKITEVLNFLVDEMNWEPSFIAKSPSVIGLSLNKKIIPRCLVYKALLSKGLVEEVHIKELLESRDEIFIEKFVKRYWIDAPELLDIYEKGYEK